VTVGIHLGGGGGGDAGNYYDYHGPQSSTSSSIPAGAAPGQRCYVWRFSTRSGLLLRGLSFGLLLGQMCRNLGFW